MAILGTVKAVTGTAFIVDDSGVKRPVNVGDVVHVGDSIQTTGGASVELEMLSGIPMQIGPNQLVAFTEDLGRVLASDVSEDAVNLATIQTVIKAIESGKDVNDAIEEAGAGSISNDPEGSSFVMLMRVGEVFDALQFSFASGSVSRSEIRNARGDDIVLAGLGSSAGTGSNGAGGGNGGGTGAGNLRPTGTPATITPTEDTSISVPLAGTDPDGTITAITITQVPPATQGTLVYDNDGNPNTPPVPVPLNTPLTPLEASSVQFVPAPNYNGPVAPVQFTVTDNGGLTSPPATITIANIIPENDGPTGTPATITPTEDTSISVPLAGTDPDGTITAITITQVPPATQGTLVYDNDGNPNTPPVPVPLNTPLTPLEASSVQFVPAPNYNGPVAPVQFTVTDNGGLTSPPATITIANIIPENDGPTGTPATITPTEDTSISVPLAGTDPDGTITAITITQVPPATQGTLVYDNDGNPNTPPVPVPLNTPLTPLEASSVQFVPAPNYNGPVAPVQFTVTDNGGLTSPPATITIANIIPENDGPTGTPATITPTEDTPISVPLAGTDPDGTITAITITQVPPATQGTLVYDNDGNPNTPPVPVPLNTPLTPLEASSVQFVPAPNYNGPVAPVQFTVTDNGGLTSPPATITIANIIPENDGPTGTPATITPTEDTSISVPLAGTDPDGTITAITITQVPPATQGTLVYDNDGNPNTPPVPVPLNTPLTPLEASSVQFVPAPNYNGPVAPVQFTVTDNGGLTSPPATITIANIIPENDAPIATDNTASVPINGFATGNVLTEGIPDSDPEADPLTVTRFTVDINNDGTPESFAAGTPAVIANIGTITINPNGSYTFTPANDFGGIIPVVTYVVSDGSTAPAQTDTATLTLIMGNNAPPTAIDDAKPVVEDTPVSGNVLTDGTPDSDPNSNPLTVTGFTIDTNGDGTPESFTPGQTATIAGVGTLTINPNGSYSFTPAPNYVGPVPIATYAITDGLGGTDTATLTLGPVSPVNDAPVNTVPGAQTTAEDSPLVFSAANGNAITVTDPDGTTVALTTTISLTNGTFNAITGGGATITGNGTGTVVISGTAAQINAALNGASYVSPADFNGTTPVVSVSTTDGIAPAVVNTVAVTVTPVADITNDVLSTNEDTPISFNPITGTNGATADSFEGTTPQITQINGTAITAGGAGVAVTNGVVTLGAGNVLTFTPTSNFSGTVPNFTYTVASGGVTETANVSITVTAQNDAPVNTVPGAQTTAEDSPLVFSAANGNAITVTDPDGTTVALTTTISLTNGTFNAITGGGATITGNGTGTVVISGTAAQINAALNGASYVSPADFNGTTPVVSVSTTDGIAPAVVNTVAVTVTPVADITNDVLSTNEDTPISFNPITGTNGATADSFEGTTPQITQINGTAITAGGAGVAVTNGVVTLGAGNVLTFTPTSNFSGTVPNFTYTVASGGVTETANVSITVTAQNDAPVNTVPGAQTTAEDSPLVFSAANGNAITVTDPDGTTVALTTTISLTNGTFNAITGGGATITGNGTGTVVISGTAAQINAALNGASYVSPADFNGTTPVVSVSTTDGIAPAVVNTVAVTVTPVADITNDVLSTNEDTPISFNPITGTNGATADSFEGTTPQITQINGTAITAGGAGVAVTNGVVTLGAGNVLTFTPTSNFSGTVPNFTYTVASGGVTETANVSITVTAQNDAPVNTVPGAQTTAEDSPLVFSAANGNAITVTDPDGTTVALTTTISLTNGTFNAITGGGATITGNGTGTVVISGTAAQINAALNGASYVSPADFNGTTPVVSVSTTDGIAPAVVNTVAVTVTPVADITNDVLSTNEDTPISFNPITGTNGATADSFEGTTPQITQINGTAITAGGAGVAVTNGVVTLGAGNVLTFTPTSNFSGTVPNFTYTVASGGVTETANVSITVTAQNDAPTAVADTNTAVESGVNPGNTAFAGTPTATGNVLTNDTDIDASDTKTLTLVNATNIAAVGNTTIVGVYGSLSIAADGTYTYTLNNTDTDTQALAQGQVVNEVFNYTMRDTAGLTSSSTLTVAITGTNDRPVLDLDLNNSSGAAGVDYNATYTENSAAIAIVDTDVTVTDVDDTNIESATITLTNPLAGDVLAVGGLPPGITQTIVGNVITLTGTATLSAYQTALRAITYANSSENPATTERVFSIIVNDGSATSAAAVSTILVVAVNDAPVDGDETNVVTEDVTLNVPVGPNSLLANTTDVDGGAARITSFLVAGNAVPFAVAAGSPGVAIIANVGTLTINSDGSYSFAPAANYAGAIPVITYTVSDGAGGTNTSTLTLGMTPVNDAPITVVDTYTVVEGTTASLSTVLANDSDVEGSPLTTVQFATNTSGLNTADADGTNTVTTALGGTVVMNTNGTFTYTAPVRNHGDAIADVDSFAYKASDGTASSAWTTVNINIADTNPIANNDVDSVGIGSTVTGNVITGAGGITADTLNVDAPFNLTSVTLTQGTQVSNNLNTTTNVRTIVTNNGTLAIDLDDGSYSYTAGVTPRVVTNPTGVASFTAQGISLYGFDTANEPYTTANNPASGLNLGSLNATSAGLVRFVDNAAENNDGVGVEQAAGTSNTNRVENTEQLVMGLGVASKSTSIALSDLFAGENVAWDAYDAAGVRVTNGTTTGDADGLVNINISSGTAFSYVVLRSSATSTTTTTPVSNFRVDGATVIPEPTGLPDRFTYTLTDSDGDTSSATLTLNYDSTTTTVNDVATVFESGIDGTLTQNPGTQDGQAIETVRGNVLANDTGVSSFTQITNVNGSTPDANGVITFSDARGTVQIYTQNFGTFVKGDYVVTLTGRTTQGVNDVLTYNYQLQNSVSGQTNTQTLTVNIVDDAPIAENTSTFAALAPVPVYNVFFMIDVSGSMTAAGASGDQRLVDSSGNAIVTTSTAAGGDPVTMTGGTNWGSATLGTSTLAQTRDAVKAVITKYFQESSNVSIELGIFSSGARYDNVSYTTLASALAAVDNLTNVTGGTNYSAGLTALQGMIGAVANPNDGVNRVAYFMTDGVPGSASGTINNAGATITSDTANPANTTGYTTFITNNNIKSYALAVGPAVPNTTALTGVHNADADASDVAGVSNGRDTPIIVTDVVSLTNALINTVPESFSGSIAGSGGISSIQFGADGGYVEYIDLVLDSADAGTVPDTTVRFTFNGTNTITNNNGAIAGGTITGSILTISATQGFTRGSLIFDFKTGEYTFVPQGTVTQGDQITIGFGIIDADGDRAAAVNTITIVNGKPIAQDDYDTLLPSTGLVTDKFFEGNVLNATGTDGGGQEFTGFGNGQDGRDYLIDNADVTSMVFKGFNFNLTAVVANGTAAAGTGGTYGVTAAGELTWTSSTDATNVLVFHRDGYYKYTPPAANVQTLPQDATQNVSFANNATNATTNGVTLGAYSRTANLNNAPDTTVDFNATGAGVATGTANQLDNLENFSIVFNRANHPQGVQNVTININAANSSLGNNGFGSIGALQYSIYDTAGELLGQFASDQEGIITIPSQYSNIGRILIQANSTNTGAGTAGSALIAGVSFNSINISAAAGIPDDTIQYTLTDQNGDTSTATLYMQYITNTFTGVVGNESVTGTSSNDLITETAGGGTLLGLAGNDIIRGGVGGDTIDGGIGDDILEGNGGNDSMIGGLGTDSLYGGDGNDFLNGSDVANSATDLRDDLYGGAGNDTISGGAGNDLIVGGEGNDILTGGIGSDTFRWELSDKGLKGTPATDVINDFDVAPASSGGDVIDLRDLLTGESAGTLANYLHFEKIGNDTIIHISSNGDFATGFNAVKDVQKITLTNADLVQAFTDDQSIINNLIANQKLITD